MTYNEMMNTIKRLAKSQGFYGRLYRNIINYVGENISYRQDMEYLASRFNNVIDLVLYFEE